MKRTLIALLLSTSLLFLVGCGSKDKDETANNTNSSIEQSESNDKNNTSKNDSENKKEDSNEKETDSNKTESTTENTNTTTEKNEKVNISIFYPNDNADGLNEKTVTINHLTAYSIINSLADNKVVPSGTTALNFEIKNNIGYLDVSSSIYNSHSGSSGETLMLDSIRETFIKAFNLQKIKLTVNGSTYTGSHIDLGANDFL